MRFHEIQLSERLVPSRQVAVKAEPATTPTSKYEKALPLFNPQMPPPLPPEMILAQSLGQLVQTDQQALAMDAQLAQQAAQKPQPQQPSQPPAAQDLAQGQPVAEANYGQYVKALDMDKDFVPAVAASLAGHAGLGGLLYAANKDNTPPVATNNQVAPIAPTIPKAPDATALPKAKGDQPEGLPNQRPAMKSIDDPRQSGPAYKQLYLSNKDTITDPNKIKIGQVIDLPNGTAYTVKPGDTLSGIAQRFKRMSESMMPSKNFAGSKQNPINGKGIKRGNDKTPVKQGDLVGAAESRVNEDEEPGFIQSIANKMTQSAIQAGLEDGTTKDVVMWAAKNAMQPAPTWITKYYPGIRDDATVGELVLAGTIDAAMMVPIVRGARLAYAGGRAALGAAEKGIGAATVAGAEKVATKGAGMAATSATTKEVGKGIAQGASEFAGNTLKGAGNLLNKIGTGGGGDSYSNPVQAGKAAIKKRLSKGDTIPIPMDGKVYTLPIVDIQGNSYIVDVSSVAGKSAGSKTMTVPIG